MQSNLRKSYLNGKSLICYIAFAVSFFACTREAARPTNTNSTLILKEVLINDSNNNFVHKLSFSYDNLQRVSTLEFYTLPLSATSPQTFRDTFYYNLDNTLPWKIYSTLSIPGQTEKHFTSTLTYDAQGRKIKDSVSRDDILLGSYERKYTRGPNYIVDTYVFNDSILFINGNMSRAYGKSGASKTLYTYDSVDNKINPYSKLNIAEAYFKRHLYPTDDFTANGRPNFNGHFNMQALNTNNIINWSLTYFVGTPDEFKLFYQSSFVYNNDNYPIFQDLIITYGIPNNPEKFNHLKYTYIYY